MYPQLYYMLLNCFSSHFGNVYFHHQGMCSRFFMFLSTLENCENFYLCQGDGCEWYFNVHFPDYYCKCLFCKNCILGIGVHVQNMQDSCIGTHVAVWFAAFLPFTHIWHFSHAISPQLPPPHCHSPRLPPPDRPQCVMFPSLCPCVLIVQYPLVSENMWCLVVCFVSIC